MTDKRRKQVVDLDIWDYARAGGARFIFECNLEKETDLANGIFKNKHGEFRTLVLNNLIINVQINKAGLYVSDNARNKEKIFIERPPSKSLMKDAIVELIASKDLAADRVIFGDSEVITVLSNGMLLYFFDFFDRNEIVLNNAACLGLLTTSTIELARSLSSWDWSMSGPE